MDIYTAGSLIMSLNTKNKLVGVDIADRKFQLAYDRWNDFGITVDGETKRITQHHAREFLMENCLEGKARIISNRKHKSCQHAKKRQNQQKKEIICKNRKSIL